MEQEPKSPRERVEVLISLLVSDWRPTPRQVLWVVRIGVVLSILVALGYSYGITLWDWGQLLIVPVVIAAGGFWFSQQQQERALQVESQRTQDAVLQAYLDQMGQLLLDKDKPLRQSKEGDEESILARARTLTALSQLDGKRKTPLIQFLTEARLIQGNPGMVGWESVQSGWAQNRPIIGLTSADLSHIDLRGADLNDVLLGEANLSGANLSGADLGNTILWDADLTDANLFGATVTWIGQLNSCKSLKGATMPNGEKYENWLEGKEGRARTPAGGGE